MVCVSHQHQQVYRYYDRGIADVTIHDTYYNRQDNNERITDDPLSVLQAAHTVL